MQNQAPSRFTFYARPSGREGCELKRIVNSLLQNIDEYLLGGNTLIAATNHSDLLDKAIWRRFYTIIEIAAPEDAEIEQLLRLHLGNGRFNLELSDKHTELMVELLRGNTPSDIKAICHNAIAQSILRGKGALTIGDILLETYYYQNHERTSIKDLMDFLRVNGTSYATISSLMNISLRQVHKHFKQET